MEDATLRKSPSLSWCWGILAFVTEASAQLASQAENSCVVSVLSGVTRNIDWERAEAWHPCHQGT